MGTTFDGNYLKKSSAKEGEKRLVIQIKAMAEEEKKKKRRFVWR